MKAEEAAENKLLRLLKGSKPREHQPREEKAWKDNRLLKLLRESAASSQESLEIAQDLPRDLPPPPIELSAHDLPVRGVSAPASKISEGPNGQTKEGPPEEAPLPSVETGGLPDAQISEQRPADFSPDRLASEALELPQGPGFGPGFQVPEATLPPPLEPEEIGLELLHKPLLHLYAPLTLEDLGYLEKLMENQATGAVRYFLFSQKLMGNQLPGNTTSPLNLLLAQYMKHQFLLLNRLLVQVKLGRDVQLSEYGDPEHHSRLLTLKKALSIFLDHLEEQRVSSISLQEETLLLVSTIDSSDLAYLHKIVGAGEGPLFQKSGLIPHLIFSQALMAKEVVTQSPGTLSLMVRVREDLSDYSQLSMALLNRMLVQARLGKTVRITEAVPELDALLQAILQGFRSLLSGRDLSTNKGGG